MNIPRRVSVGKYVWLEEYRNCSCSYIAKSKKELPGCCPKHGTDQKLMIRLPKNGFTEDDIGYVSGN